MPPVDKQGAPINEDETFFVLITGFGVQPFHSVVNNPSWLAAKPLQNLIIPIEDPLPPISVDGVEIAPWRQIHISALEIPVIYEAVLDIVPDLHRRPPIIPPCAEENFPEPPAKGYDFVFHMGVAGRGPLRMERLAHKFGYQMRDAASQLAPTVKSSVAQDFERNRDIYLGQVNMEMLAVEMDTSVDGPVRPPTRGFGKGYEKFPDELMTQIDCSALVHILKASGFDQSYTSMDAGHYLCDFIYYCSLAEATRDAYEKGHVHAFAMSESRGAQVLFLHIPPVDSPLSTSEVTAAAVTIIKSLAKVQRKVPSI